MSVISDVLPTTYIGGVAHVLHGESLRIIAESVHRRHQSRQTICLRHRTPRGMKNPRF